MSHYSKKHIQSLRTRLQLSQERFARTLGVSFATVNRWETGKTRPSQLSKKMLRMLEKEMNMEESAK